MLQERDLSPVSICTPILEAKWSKKLSLCVVSTLGGLLKNWLLTDLLLEHLWKEALICISVAVLTTFSINRRNLSKMDVVYVLA